MKLEKGTRVYNGGDMCNQSHFGVISKVTVDRWGTQLEITPDPGSDREGPYTVSPASFSPVYLGHGGTRFVTEQAYVEWRERQIAKYAKG